MSDEPYASPRATAERSPTKSWLGCAGFAALALICGAVLFALFLPQLTRGRGGERRAQCRNNLKQIGLALHNYHDTYHAFPPAYTVNEQGQRLHSWRTLILPFLDANPLYLQIDLRKPWDDPANEAVRNQKLPGYSCPSSELPKFHTNYLAIVGPGTCFPGAKSCSLSDITDAQGDTLLVMEFSPNHSVHWMSPQDADEAQVTSVGWGDPHHLAHEGGTHALFADGRARFLDSNLPAATRRAILTISGGEPVKW